MTESTDISAHKTTARQFYLTQRTARSQDDRRRAELTLLERARQCEATVIAAFVPVRGEPGSLDVLDELARRATVLLPITGALGTPLEWAAYGGRQSLVRGPLGLQQPPGPDGSLLADAEVVLVPALAIGRDGSRLGHGGGFYDRALAGMPTERLYGVVHDDEVAESLPVEEHDVRIGWLCTPSETVRLVY